MYQSCKGQVPRPPKYNCATKEQNSGSALYRPGDVICTPGDQIVGGRCWLWCLLYSNNPLADKKERAKNRKLAKEHGKAALER